MFGLFKKKKKKTLFIHARDVIDIIKEDYDDDDIFGLIEFKYNDEIHRMGSDVLEDFENDDDVKKEDIKFIFDENQYDTLEELVDNARVAGFRLKDLAFPIEVLKAGFMFGMEMLDDPYGDTRLAKHAVEVLGEKEGVIEIKTKD